MTKLSEHFDLSELIPDGFAEADVPHPVRANLTQLAAVIEEPRAEAGAAFVCHSGWRPDEYNSAHGGVRTSDHPSGRALDFHVAGNEERSWEDATLACFDWIREHMAGRYGQLILEDQRAHFGQPGKLWIHFALPSKKHPGSEKDPNRLLVCHAPGQYIPWTDGRFA